MCQQDKTSAAKPEMHNVSQRRKRRIKPQPQTTSTEYLVQFGSVSASKQIDRPTDIDITTSLPPGERAILIVGDFTFWISLSLSLKTERKLNLNANFSTESEDRLAQKGSELLLSKS